MADDRMKNDDLQRNMGAGEKDKNIGQQSPGRGGQQGKQAGPTLSSTQLVEDHRLDIERALVDEASAEADQEKIGFEYVEGPVTPKPEKLPGARKRKPKPSGPGGGPKGPATRGPLVKV